MNHAELDLNDRTTWEQRSLDRIGAQALRKSHRILGAAREIVSEGGLELLSLRALLDRAGVSRRAFYDRFASMDDLLLALYEETMVAGGRELERRIDRSAEPDMQFETAVRAIATMSQERPQARTYMLAMSSHHVRLAEQRPNELTAALRPMTRLLAEILERTMTADAARATDAQELAESVYAFISSEIHRSFHLGRQGDAWIDSLTRFCVRGACSPTPRR